MTSYVKVSHNLNLSKCIRVGCKAKARHGLLCKPHHIRFKAHAKEIASKKPLPLVRTVNGRKMWIAPDAIEQAIAFLENYSEEEGKEEKDDRQDERTDDSSDPA